MTHMCGALYSYQRMSLCVLTDGYNNPHILEQAHTLTLFNKLGT